MAKARTKTKRVTKKRTAKKNQDLSLQIIKVISSIAILLVLVLGVGLLADLLLSRPKRHSSAAIRPDSHLTEPRREMQAPVRKPESKKPTAPAPLAEPQHKPVYEVPAKEDLPTKPLVPLPQLPGQRKPLVAIVIDDIGYDRQMAEELMALDIPLTFSMLPFGTFSRAILDQARARALRSCCTCPWNPMNTRMSNPVQGLC